MTDFVLYREPTVLDVVKHRHLKLLPLADHSMTAGMHSCFVTAAEIAHAAREFMIVFVRDGVDAAAVPVQPIALLGVGAGENLFVDGTRWNAGYVPAYIRRYPFWAAQIEGVAAPALLFDKWWHGFSEIAGEALYDADAQPSPRLAEAIGFVENFEVETARTRAFCERLVALDVLRELTATLALPDGSKRALNGLLAVDETLLRALPDASVLELHRSGMLALISAHRMSLANLQGLAERKAKRMQAAAPA